MANIVKPASIAGPIRAIIDLTELRLKLLRREENRRERWMFRSRARIADAVHSQSAE